MIFGCSKAIFSDDAEIMVATIPASATAGLILAGVWRELSRG